MAVDTAVRHQLHAWAWTALVCFLYFSPFFWASFPSPHRGLQIKERVGFFHFNLMLILAGIIGVFTALDLFLFYFFWELMLVPMYFLISIWGHENRTYAAIKFFIFTQASGLFMLLAILGLYFIHGRTTGVYTFRLL